MYGELYKHLGEILASVFVCVFVLVGELHMQIITR